MPFFKILFSKLCVSLMKESPDRDGPLQSIHNTCCTLKVNRPLLKFLSVPMVFSLDFSPSYHEISDNNIHNSHIQCVCVCVRERECVCVCVCERERVCVCVCV